MECVKTHHIKKVLNNNFAPNNENLPYMIKVIT